MQEEKAVTSPVNSTCPICHTAVRQTDYFCFNCGANLKPAPPKADTTALLSLILVTLFLPPLGIIKGAKYLKYDDPKLKLVGIAAIVLTIVELIVLTIWTVGFINKLNEQVNSQVNNIMGF